MVESTIEPVGGAFDGLARERPASVVTADPEPALVIVAARDQVAPIPIIPLAMSRRRPIGVFVKRLIDLTGAAVGLVLLSPILLAVATWIVVAEGGPVFFRQVRVGQGGRLFTIVKFRTMVPDAEDRFLDVAPLNDHEGAAFKMDNDPRVTGSGRILRRTSIDELPQLWNVLLGEMSLVGPRPAPPREVADYQGWHYERLTVKPGITGAWQVTARLDNSFDRRAELDIDYVRNWSLRRDLLIMLKTLPAVLRQTGR